jgi:hypothetical protein
LSKHNDDGAPAIAWRRLTPTLWVGLDPDGVIGCIEIGRRCLVTDGEGHVFGRFRRLTDAQAMLALLYRQTADELWRHPAPAHARATRTHEPAA